MQDKGECIKDGAFINLYHPLTNGHLVGSTSNLARIDNAAYQVTVSKEIKDEALVTTGKFTCVSVEKNRCNLCWGIPFQIIYIDESSYPSKKLYLASVLKMQHQVTTFSCEQQVYLTETNDSTTHWKALVPANNKNSGKIRFLMEGTPIAFHQPMIIVHCMTNNMLCSEIKYSLFNPSSAMREYEVFCCSRYGSGMVHNLRDELNGLRTSETICRINADEHIWMMMLVAPINEQALSSSRENEHATKQEEHSLIISKLSQQGLLSLSVLRWKLLQEATVFGSSSVSLCKVFHILVRMGIVLEEDEIHLISSFKEDTNDQTQVGDSVDQINIFSLISHIRGPKAFQADQIICRIFNTIVNKDGTLDESYFREKIESIDSACFTRGDAFLSTFGKVTENVFLELHRDLFCTLSVYDDDNYGDTAFTNFITKLWSTTN